MLNTLTKKETDGRQAALKRAQKLWGNKAAVEYRKNSLNMEQKDRQRETIAAVKADKEMWVQKSNDCGLREDLIRALANAAQFVIDVDADPTAIQALKNAVNKLKTKDHAQEQRQHFDKQLKIEMGKLHGFRCTVGTIDNMGFSVFCVNGQGDTWDEAFEKAAAKK